jgi:hypothetical protein
MKLLLVLFTLLCVQTHSVHAEEKFEFVDLVAYDTADIETDTCDIRGKLKNNSDKTITHILVKFRCYDASGKLLAQYWPKHIEYGFYQPFAPKTATAFATMKTPPEGAKPIANVKKIEVTILEVIYK